MAKILIACEYSGTVRRAFRNAGHDAWSADILDAEDGSPFHIKGDARELLDKGWDGMIAHPPCTRLTLAGVRWLNGPPKGRSREEMWQELREGAELFAAFLNAPIERIAVENPIMHRHAKERIVGFFPATQTIQPWQFGHGEIKGICLWLKGLKPLVPTNVVSGRQPRVHHASPGPDRWKERSKFFDGVAKAMVSQWFPLDPTP